MTKTPSGMFHYVSLAMGALLLFGAAANARAQAQPPVRAAIDEAASVQAIATAARLCNEISETELTRATNRMDQVHAAQLGEKDQETYLILRGSASFRNTVFASALKRVQGGCNAEIGAVWRDVDASLLFANVLSRQTLATTGSANLR